MPALDALLGGSPMDTLAGMPTPGMEQNPLASAGVSALDGLMGGPKQGPSASMNRVEEAYDLAHKLVMSTLPQLAQWNPKLARDAHAAGRTLLGIKADIRKEAVPQPPPDLMMGMGLGGAPGPLGPTPQGAGAGGMLGGLGLGS